MHRIFVMIITIALALVIVVSDILLMYSTKNPKYRWFLIIVALIYLIDIPIWYVIMKSDTLSSIAIIFSITIVIGAVLSGYFLFGDNITIRKMIGFAFGIIAIILIEV